jgi:signal transduction histidine kinase
MGAFLRKYAFDVLTGAGRGGRGPRGAGRTERAAATRIAVAEEHPRIARELHDVVAHSVSVMVLQVGPVRHQLPQSQVLRN